jgi:hypothetical protein
MEQISICMFVKFFVALCRFSSAVLTFFSSFLTLLNIPTLYNPDHLSAVAY